MCGKAFFPTREMGIAPSGQIAINLTRFECFDIWLTEENIVGSYVVGFAFTEILSIIAELVMGVSIETPGDVVIVGAVAAVITNVPMLMIYLGKILPYKANRMANIGASLFTIVQIVGRGSCTRAYIIIAGIEVTVQLVVVKVVAWTPREEKSLQSQSQAEDIMAPSIRFIFPQ